MSVCVHIIYGAVREVCFDKVELDRDWKEGEGQATYRSGERTF